MAILDVITQVPCTVILNRFSDLSLWTGVHQVGLLASKP